VTSDVIREEKALDRAITVSFRLRVKNPVDDYLVHHFGDVVIDPSGLFHDPNDPSYIPFYVYAGDPVSFFTEGVISATFEDDNEEFELLVKHAEIWGNIIQARLIAAIIKLRSQTFDGSITPIPLPDVIPPVNPSDNDTYVILNDVFATNVPFKFDNNSKAIRLSSVDEAPPFVDGVVLSSGGVGDARKVANIVGKLYDTVIPFTGLGVYCLSKTGTLTQTMPSKANGDKWLCVIARVVTNTRFIIQPQTPILL
jgi:hypothetical protein